SILAGEAHAHSPAEQVALAEMALSYRKLPVQAAEWFRDAFSIEPRLAEVHLGHRYNAACAAALAATCEPLDGLDDADRSAWQKQALVWLAADLAELKKSSESQIPKPGVDFPQGYPSLAAYLSHWLRDPDLAGIRDSNRLKWVPAAEREGFEAFWQD